MKVVALLLVFLAFSSAAGTWKKTAHPCSLSTPTSGTWVYCMSYNMWISDVDCGNKIENPISYLLSLA